MPDPITHEDFREYHQLMEEWRQRHTANPTLRRDTMPRATPTPIPTPALPQVVPFTLNSVPLEFWLEKRQNGDTVLMVKKADDHRPLNICTRYAVCTITRDGNFYRNRGLPSGWGFALTMERRIKEVR